MSNTQRFFRCRLSSIFEFHRSGIVAWLEALRSCAVHFWLDFLTVSSRNWSKVINQSQIFFFLDKVKNTANVTLLMMMFLAIYSQYVVSDPFERIGPTMVFSFMLIGRLVIYYQVSSFNSTSKSLFQLNFPFCKKDFPSKIRESFCALRCKLWRSLTKNFCEKKGGVLVDSTVIFIFFVSLEKTLETFWKNYKTNQNLWKFLQL